MILQGTRRYCTSSRKCGGQLDVSKEEINDQPFVYFATPRRQQRVRRASGPLVSLTPDRAHRNLTAVLDATHEEDKADEAALVQDSPFDSKQGGGRVEPI